MRYVGIRNSPVKAAALRRAPVASTAVPARALAFDCVRHLDLLERAGGSRGDAEVLDSLYCRYLTWSGRSRDAALERARTFLALYDEIRVSGFDYAAGRMSVTADGIRLNGSHRAAIAAALDLGEVAVDVHPWPAPFGTWRAREALAEADVKRRGQLAFLDRPVRDRESRELLGRVAWVDAAVDGRRWWSRPDARLVLVVETGDELARVAADAVEAA